MIIVSIRYVHNHNEPVADPEISEGDTPRNGAYFRNDKKELGSFWITILKFYSYEEFLAKRVV